MNRHQAYALLAALEPGQPVTLTRDHRDLLVTVQRPITPADGGGFGSWDYANVTVGYGPGRFNMEVNAAGIEAGRYQIRLGHPTDDDTQPCQVCGIPARFLPGPGVYVHAEPRTLANNLHNGTPDHNAVVVPTQRGAS